MERRRTVGFSPPRKPLATSPAVSYRAGVDSAAPPGSPARRLARRSWASISAVGLVVLLALAAATLWAVGRGTDEASLAPPAPPAGEPLGQVAGAGVPNDRVPTRPRSLWTRRVDGWSRRAPQAEPSDDPRGLLVSLGPGSLVRIDARTGRTLASVPIAFPRQVSSDGRSVWALGAEGLGKRVLLTRVESTTAAATDIFDAGAYPPAPLGFAVAGGRAWFSDEDGNGYRFARDASAGESVRLDPVSRYFYLPFAAAGSLWVSSPPLVLRVDPSTGQVRARLDGIAVVVAAGKGFLWALNYTAREIVRVDTKTNATATVGRVAFQWADLAVADGAVWASDPQDNAIVRLDPVTGMETERIHLGRQPGALASGDGALWIALPWAGAVTRYDLASGRTETIDVGGTPNDLVFARGSVWVGVEVLTREAYVASAEAICKAASGRFLAAVAALDLPRTTRSLEDVAAFHEVAVRFSEETLSKLRALREPKAGRATLRNDLVLREQEIDLMRKIVDAAAAGDAARAEELGRERVELTHRRGAYLPSKCPVDLPA